MSDFWEKQGQPDPSPQHELVLDEQVVAEIQGDPEFEVFEDDENDTLELMSDANLRLEQGRLYQMVLANDIFGQTDADPKAIRNVQREIRKFVRDRMEIMLGIKQEQALQTPIVSSPFNDLEVSALKMLASKLTGGKTEESVQSAPMIQAQPKKDGITAISGNLRPQGTPSVTKPVTKSTAKPASKQPVKQAKSALVKTESAVDEGPGLTKPINEMTPEELVAYNKAAEERSARKRAAPQQNLVPHPTPQSLELMYAGIASNQSLNVSGMRPYRIGG
jgi:hypothetical protein